MKAPSCDRRVNAEERRSLIACRERDGATLYRSTQRGAGWVLPRVSHTR